MRPVLAVACALLVGQVSGIFGEPEETTDRMDGRLEVTTATFSHDGHRLDAEFVDGVLVKCSLSST